jgi:hypothetical protein
VSSGADRTFVTLNGLDTNLEPALKLFEQLLSAPKPDAAALKNMVAGTLKARQDAKLEKRVILNQAMVNFVKHGPKNPFHEHSERKRAEGAEARAAHGPD